MDLFCPHCTRRVTIPDDKAGQVLSCPLCTKQFMAPSLAPATPPAPRPVTPPASVPASGSSYGVGPTPTPPPTSYETAAKPTPSEMSKPPAPPPPPGEYTRTLTLVLRSSWLAFVPTVCLVLIFILSFFNWHQSLINVLQPTNTVPPLSLWGLAFTEHGQGLFLAYTLFLILGFFLCIAALLFETNIFYAPQLAPLVLWKDLIAGVFLLIPLVLLCFDYVDSHFIGPVNPIALAMKVAFRLHLLAVLASFLMFWLHWRMAKNLPLPKWEMRW